MILTFEILRVLFLNNYAITSSFINILVAGVEN